MKKILLTLSIILGCHLVSAQAPEKMSYQAVMRNTTGQLLANQSIGIKVSILQGSAAGTAVYSERLTGSTNLNGLISLEIGTGTVLSGTFNTIDWSTGNYWLKTETDPTGGTSYTITGTSQLLSVPYAMYAKSSGGGGSLTLPYTTTLTNAANLFDITNNGDGASLSGTSGSTSSSISAVKGTVTSTAPGGFSSAVRAINNGTAGLGIGAYGSQAGSGWGVYGTTPAGIGVYGNASGAGTGVLAGSNSGIGLSATSTTGIVSTFAITNNANANNVISANSNGNGTVINVQTTGMGSGVSSSSGSGFAVQGLTTQQSSAAIIGDNSGAGEAVVGRTTSDIAGAVVGRNDGGGYGVRGFIGTNTTGTGVGVFGQVGGSFPSASGSKGRAGRFENNNSTNTGVGGTLEVYSNTAGGFDFTGQAAGILSTIDNTNSIAPAIYGKVNTIFGNFGAAGVYGESSGTGGFGGLFYSSNVTGNGNTLISINNGNGDAIVGNAKKNGDGVDSSVNGTGRAIYGWVPSFGTGKAAEFQNFNDANNNTVLTSKTIGNGEAGYFEVDNTSGTSAAVHGKVNSIFSNFGTAGIYGESAGTGGFGGLFYASNVTGNGPALIAIAKGNGNAMTASADKLGDGVESTITGSGRAIYGWVTSTSTGKAAVFQNFNTANGNATATILNAGTGIGLLVNHTGASGNLAVFQSAGANVARIDKTGKGFFNNGTQSSGADLAEAFDVEGHVSSYEPGDILVISTKTDRSVEKSSEPYSTLVAGVYATKPGVLLTEEHFESTLDDKVPMGVIGVIPTKVCLEGGAIKRGDLLVTSSTSGVAMKADLEKVKIGQVLGKALQDYDQNEIGKIKVLVSIK